MSISLDTINANRRRERIFFSMMIFAVAITVFGGFARTFYLRGYFVPESLPNLLRLHGLVFSSWIVLFFTQTVLIAAKRVDIHRRLGIAGGVLAALMVIIGTLTAIIRAKSFDPPPGFSSPLIFLTIPLGDMLVFAILVTTGLWFRRQKNAHKSLMLLATIAILPAAVARLPFAFIQAYGPIAFFGLSDLFILPLIAFEYFVRGQVQRSTILGGLLIVASHPLRLIIGNTHAWLVFATWLTHWTT